MKVKPYTPDRGTRGVRAIKVPLAHSNYSNYAGKLMAPDIEGRTVLLFTVLAV
jgi:hypothetical protein